MRIALLASDFPILTETFVLNQVTGLLARGHDVDVFPERSHPSSPLPDDVARDALLARVHAERELPDNFAHRFGRGVSLLAREYRRDPGQALRALNVARHGRRAASLRLLYEGAAFAGRGAYDAILCHFGPYGLKGLRLRDAGLVRGKLVTVFHGFDVSRYVAAAGPGAYAALFARGELFLPVSEYWRQRLLALGCPAERCVVHRMGIALARFPFAPRALAPGEATVRLLSVARLVEKKGLTYALRAVAALVRAGQRVTYEILGDGPLRAALEAEARALGLAGVVRWAGAVDQGTVARALQRAHVLVAPSVTAADGDMEGIPVVLMEAMATGLPVVSTRHSGIPELVTAGESGLLVPERDAGALAEALGALVAQPERWAAMGAAGRAHVARGFDAERLHDRLIALLAGDPAADAPPVPAVNALHDASEDNPKQQVAPPILH